MAAEAPPGNGVSTTLGGSGITSTSQTTVTLVSASAFTNAQYVCIITDNTNYEIVQATGLSGSTLTIVRHFELWNGSSTSFTFAAGSTITVVTSLQSVINLINQAIDADNYLAAQGGSNAFGFESMDRIMAQLNLVMVSGTLYLASMYIPAGVTITKLGYWATTGAASPSHQWLGLYDQNRNQLAVTADQTTAVISSATKYQYSIATTASGASSSFTTTYSGLYYIGLMVAITGGAMPGPPGWQFGTSGLNGISPSRGGTSDTGQTTPPGFPHTATSITNTGYVLYAWAT